MKQLIRKTPALRFPGFTGDWEETRLQSHLEEYREKSLENGQHPVFTSSRSGLTRQDHYFGENRLTERDNTGFNIIPPNYITYRSRSDDRTFYFNENNLGITGAISVYYPVFRNKSGSNKFLIELLSKYSHRVGKYAVGTSQTVLSYNELGRIKLRIPKPEEQRKIAAFFTAVDTKIAQLENKKNILGRYTNECMKRIFSQQLRFNAANGSAFPEWQVKLVGDVLSVGSGRDYKHLGVGGVPVYGSGGYMTSVDQWLYDGDSVCIGRKGTIDKPVLLTGKFWTVDTLFYTHSFIGVDPRFVLAVFKTINWSVLSEASGVPSLSKAIIERIPIRVPHIDEQVRISQFYAALEARAERVQKQISAARSLKSGLLQQLLA